MHSLLKRIKDISIYNIQNLAPREKNLLDFTCFDIMREYEKVDGLFPNLNITSNPLFFGQFDRLKKIVWTDNIAAIPCSNAIGCATWEAVYSMYYDRGYKYNAFIMSMELAHHAVYEYCYDHNIKYPTLVANDVVHYAANAGTEPYVKWITVKHKEPLDWLKFKKPVEIPVFVYNLRYIIDERVRIQQEIKNGTAPKGVNPYWSDADDPRIVEMITKSVNHYDSEHQHDHFQ